MYGAAFTIYIVLYVIQCFLKSIKNTSEKQNNNWTNIRFIWILCRWDAFNNAVASRYFHFVFVLLWLLILPCCEFEQWDSSLFNLFFLIYFFENEPYFISYQLKFVVFIFQTIWHQTQSLWPRYCNIGISQKKKTG